MKGENFNDRPLQAESLRGCSQAGRGSLRFERGLKATFRDKGVSVGLNAAKDAKEDMPKQRPYPGNPWEM
jgi:hypothetical protein